MEPSDDGHVEEWYTCCARGWYHAKQVRTKRLTNSKLELGKHYGSTLTAVHVTAIEMQVMSSVCLLELLTLLHDLGTVVM
jgi:hypothetical protein